MEERVEYVWRALPDSPVHLAAGRGKNTACGRKIGKGWTQGTAIPEDRRFCHSCAHMQPAEVS